MNKKADDEPKVELPTILKYVHLSHPKTQARIVLEPGDECPEWALTMIDPKLYAYPGHLAADAEMQDYSLMTVAELRAECVNRDIPSDGFKKDLVDRLEEFEFKESFVKSVVGKLVPSN